MYAYFSYFLANADPNGSNVGDLDIFDFDRCTGNLSLKANVALTDSAIAGGVAFSPNSNVLYVSSSKRVWQFDLTAANIPSTQTTVATYDGFQSNGLYATFYLSQLAPDGKIYINTGEGTRYMHVIDDPDSLGMNCNFCQHCIQLPSFNAFTIANHPNYFLGAQSGTVCDSLTSVSSLTQLADNPFNVFPNPVSGNSELTFSYPSTGKRSVIVIHNLDGKEVAIYSLPMWSSIHRVKLPKISAGIYLARFVSESAAYNVKFLVE